MSEVKYPLRLCVELMQWAFLLSPTTKDMTVAEVKGLMEKLFDSETIEKALRIFAGGNEE